jgi:hypothetical protein
LRETDGDIYTERETVSVGARSGHGVGDGAEEAAPTCGGYRSDVGGRGRQSPGRKCGVGEVVDDGGAVQKVAGFPSLTALPRSD